MKIEGEQFIIENLDDGSFLLHHPKWSISGSGDTLAKAEVDVLRSAKVAAKLYFEASVHDLDTEALRMRDYLLELVPNNA